MNLQDYIGIFGCLCFFGSMIYVLYKMHEQDKMFFPETFEKKK